MCGIVGIISKNTNGLFKEEQELFTQLLFTGQIRGENGTGIFYNTKEEAVVLRDNIVSCDFIRTEEYTGAIKEAFTSSYFMVGHNRQATKGAALKEFTHPFQEKHITLVHNGTLFNQKEIWDKEVDSHAICCAMANTGEVLTLTRLQGSFSLVWYNEKEKTLNLCRNTLRPMHIIETPSLYVLCSEQLMGEWLVKRSNIPIISSYSTSPHRIYKFNRENTRNVRIIDLYPPLPNTRFSSRKESFKEVDPPQDSSVSVDRSELIEVSHIPYISCYFLYEKTPRVRIYGKLDWLKEILKSSILRGEVERRTWMRDRFVYILKNVRPVNDKEEKDLNKGGIHEEKKDEICDFCCAPIKGKKTKVDEFVVCKECVAMWDAAPSAMYC